MNQDLIYQPQFGQPAFYEGTVWDILLPFSRKTDKMHLQTEEHHAKALADIWHSEYECNLQLVTDEVIACKQ